MNMGEVLDLLVEAGVDITVPSRIPGHMICPFHAEDTASLALWDDHWHCFGCGVGGNAVDFVGRAMGASRGQAKAWLEGAIGEEIEWETLNVRREPEPIDMTERFRAEAKHRRKDAVLEASQYVNELWPHLADETGTLSRLWNWGVRVADYYLLIPHRDANRRIVGVKTRSYVGGNKGRKASFPGSTYPELYWVDLAPKGATTAILVEGESDTWTATLRWGPEFQVFGLPSGCNSWKPAYRDLLLNYSDIVVALDNDEPGDRAAEKIIADLNGHGAGSVLRMRPNGKDWTEDALA